MTKPSCKRCAQRSVGICACVSELCGCEVLERSRTVRSLPSGTVLYRGGSPVTGVAVLRAGWAATYMLGPDGRRQLLSLLLPGDAYSALMLHQPQLPFSVLALTDVEVCWLPRSFTDTLLPDLLGPVGAMAAREIQGMQRRLLDMGQRSAEQRLAGFLLDIDRRVGASEDGDWLPFPLRQYDLADLIGVSPVHVSRLLSRLRQQGVIESGRNRLRIVRLEALTRLADEAAN